jgi:uncharacterized membrane protein YhaH (DUF805 family)
MDEQVGFILFRVAGICPAVLSVEAPRSVLSQQKQRGWEAEMNWYLEVLKKYAVFNGRARRKEYWMFVLGNLIVAIIASVLDSVLFGSKTVGLGPLYLIYMLAVLVPGLAVSVRRLHDVGKSGWFILIAFIPIVGPIWLLVLTCMDGQPGENPYGPNPKAA